jgi:hypothetical protein
MSKTRTARGVLLAAVIAAVVAGGTVAMAQPVEPVDEPPPAEPAAPDPVEEDQLPEEPPPAAAPTPAPSPAGTGEEPVTGPTGLRLHFVGTDRTYTGTSYEIFSVSSRELVASGTGAIESRGEVPEVWELAPGHYKIVRRGEPFDTQVDFAVAEIQAGQVVDFLIVVDPHTGAFRGSGPLIDRGALPEGIEIAGVRVSLNGGGNLLFDQKYNAIGNTSGTNAVLGLFGHFGLIIDTEPHFLDVTASLQLNVTDRPAAGPFATTDTLEGSATYTYKLNNPYIGPYARVGFRTRVFPGYLYVESGTPNVTVNIAQLDGSVDTRTLGTEANSDDLRIRLADPLAPIILQEEVGANLQAVDLDLVLLQLVVGTRLGFGFRQGFVRGLLVVEGDEEGPVVNLREVDDYDTLGPVAGASAQVKVTRWLFGSADFGVLVPLTDTDRAGDNFGDRLLIGLSGTAGLKIPALTDLLFASFEYSFRLERDGFITSETMFDHTIMARANVTIF